MVYLRSLYEPLHQQFHPGYAPGELFPLITLPQLESAGGQPMRLLAVELVREAATLMMLAAAALAVARNLRQWFAAFIIAFGLWDVFYYVFLTVLLDWPNSLLTWDLLFLLPVPWAGPVLSPLLVSLTMIGTGTIVLRQESMGRPLHPGRLSWTTISAGAGIILFCFCEDYPNLLKGGLPSPFNWMLFLLGESLGLAGFFHAWMARPRPA